MNIIVRTGTVTLVVRLVMDVPKFTEQITVFLETVLGEKVHLQEPGICIKLPLIRADHWVKVECRCPQTLVLPVFTPAEDPLRLVLVPSAPQLLGRVVVVIPVAVVEFLSHIGDN